LAIDPGNKAPCALVGGERNMFGESDFYFTSIPDEVVVQI
jgi:hypothetical protein